MTSFQKNALWGFYLLIIGASGVSAHGPESHVPSHQHIEEMMRYKEQIPEEYRIMSRTPMPPHMSSLRRGQELFVLHCSPCHGVRGEGDGPTASALKAPPASFLDLEHSDIYGPGEKYWIIREGFPVAGMPGFGTQIEPVDRWHLVNYIHHLQSPVRRQSRGHQH